MPVRYSLGTWPAVAGVSGNSVSSQRKVKISEKWMCEAALVGGWGCWVRRGAHCSLSAGEAETASQGRNKPGLCRGF